MSVRREVIKKGRKGRKKVDERRNKGRRVKEKMKERKKVERK